MNIAEKPSQRVVDACVAPRVRVRLIIRGAVQGGGFRRSPFHLSTELGLAGWGNNPTQGVFAEIEGERAPVEDCRRELADSNDHRLGPVSW